MDIKLSIETDFKKASKAFNELANESEATREKIEKFSSSFQTEKLDKFIDKQKLLEASLLGTRGEVLAMTTAQKNYEKEIERLIRSGLDPESDAIKKLRGEHDKLKDKIEVTTKVHELQEKAVKASIGALAAIGAAIAGMGAYSLKAAAATEDMTAAFTPLMGSAERAAKLVSQISMEAAKTPFEIEKIGSSVKALLPAFNGSSQSAMEVFRMIGDTAQGNSQKLDSITTAYSKVMLKGKVSMQELNMIAGAGVPIYAELAQNMGVSVEEMMKLSSEGKITSDDLTKVFQTMTSEGGVFFNGMEVSSTTFSSTLLGIKENIGIVAGEIGAKLLPAAKEIAGKIYDVTRNLIEWINTGDNFKRTVDIMTYAIAGLAGGLTAFLVISKGATIIHGLATAFKALTSAIAANPIGAIAVVVTAVLIPALIALYKNWDTVSTYLQQGIARLEYAFKWLGSVIKEGFVVAFNTVKAAASGFLGFIVEKVLGGIQNMLDVLSNIPGIGDMFQKASEKVGSLKDAVVGVADEAKRASQEAIANAHAEQNATEERLKSTLAGIDAEAQARRAAIEAQKKENEEIVQNEEEVQEQITALKTEAQSEQIKTLKERLSEIALTEKQTQNEQIEQLSSFLQQRMDLELGHEQSLKDSEIENAEARLEWLKEQRALLMADENLTGDEKVALEKSVNEMILAEDEKLKKAQEKLLQEKLKATNTFFQGISDIAALGSKQSIGLLIIEKAAASTQAAINSYLAFTSALKDVPYPFNIAAAAGVLASGIAQQAKIISTAIPSAETGGRFIVPNSPGSDSAIMRVNQGEEVDITPRGMVGSNRIQNVIVQIEKQTIFDVVNDGLRGGDILIQAVNF